MREIKPIDHCGSIQLKFSFSGKRYSLNPIPGGDYNNRRDLATAKAIANKIQIDILAGCFDDSLDRYRLLPKQNNSKPNRLLELWDLWVNSLDLSPATKANHYKAVRTMIAKSNPSLTEAQWLTNSKLASRTVRDRLSMLRCCYNWAIEQGLVDANPYLTIKLKKSPVTRIKPFTTTEILAITQGFEQLAPHYTPFVKFLFLTGVRLSEAIGLRWVDVDCSRSEITIAESLPKDLTGNGYTRIRKSTKTGSVRVLPMSQALRETLAAIAPTHELVFTSVGGSIIDADNFRMRHWKPILKAVAVPYRKIHNTRHTMISHALEQGIAPTGIAYLAGHIDTRMVLTTYGHMINKPQLPELF
ncbi:tyrosine-type recombinase/integrase [Gloeocapsopsis dulcis]|uniref:Site-specific integrase n=3 Tax=Gloeocapsopsis TaxID=693222 RepID=A0A6N8G4V6_9CHRO|nr:site-specific integrase [Gloeocapsopsis dulcis AAB1 = 1H9]